MTAICTKLKILSTLYYLYNHTVGTHFKNGTRILNLLQMLVQGPWEWAYQDDSNDTHTKGKQTWNSSIGFGAMLESSRWACFLVASPSADRVWYPL